MAVDFVVYFASVIFKVISASHERLLSLEPVLEIDDMFTEILSVLKSFVMVFLTFSINAFLIVESSHFGVPEEHAETSEIITIIESFFIYIKIKFQERDEQGLQAFA